ncbi:MAG: glycosyltransferase family 4 protein [Chitinophagaceae bacterium]|nr:MAG: glycosyltransferase family 4 protein [Chitinophagaceae bacterium]
MPYLIIAAFLLIIELIYFRLASRFNITDNPNHRSSHTRPTIRGGGIIFPIAVLCFGLWYSSISWWWITGLFLISLVSLLDDIQALPNKARIAIHLVAVSMMFYSLHIFTLWPLAFILIGYVFVIGTINAWNFMDGINGITALYTLSVLLTLWYLNDLYAFADKSLILVLGMAAFIFGFFNCRRKAVCFAGDVGAVSLAYILIFLVLSLMIMTDNVVFILLFAVYGVDSIMTIFYRLSRKENIFQAHRSHLYQLMANEYKMSHLSVSVIYFLAQMIVNIILILMLRYALIVQWFMTAGILLLLTILYWTIRYRLTRTVLLS